MEATPIARKDNSGDVCVICLSEVTERAVTTPCNHYTFDFLCLVSWLQQRSTCPLCKAEVTAVQYDWRSPSDYKNYAVQTTRPRNPPTNTFNLPSLHRLPRRPYASRPSYTPPTPDIALLRRQHVYRHKLFSLYVGSNRISRYGNLTPEMVATSPELQSRARTWIRRELRVFTFLHTDPEGRPLDGATTSSSAEFLLTYIVSILKTLDIKGSSGQAEELLKEFLGRENTRLFLHEMGAWLRSPFAKLDEWDRNVQYLEQLPDEFDEEGRAIERPKTTAYPSRSRSPAPD
ncbi:hypothetical protein K504DRAFT_384498 [Pleomassaria siparia CBS 279.74]|uniref:RING-type E3 ubiquitin transferase n=1 Tax=Pleomassaria siparia CBS 279.74 TaxID=1314801 RepID=A0A6G1K3Z8_9PLEO|nr:hypothetical protein K504DRAFT_384498 [Pleomassaria siparia CBS 279.74]